MEKDGDAAIQTTDFFGMTQKRLIALRPADLSTFTADEIAMVDAVLDQLRPMTGAEVSLWSHRFPGWEAVENQETIDYQWVYLDRRRLTGDEIDFGRKVAQRLGA